MGNRSITAINAAATERAEAAQLLIAQMRGRDKTFREIAKLMGMSVSSVHDNYKKARNRRAAQTSEAIDTIRQQDLGIIEDLLDRHVPAALEGNRNATALVLKVLKRKADLLGLDAPAKLDTNMNAQVGVQFLNREQMRLTVQQKLAEQREQRLAAVDAQLSDN